MIIGLTGGYAAGKDTVADILIKKGFSHVSLSDILREELKIRKKKPIRDNLIVIGNELRTNYGPSILAERALLKTKDDKNYVFTSIRNPSEVKLLMKKENFVMVNITSPDEVRFARIVKRRREGDPASIIELRDKERLENTSNPNSQQLDKVAKMAKVILDNNGTMEQLNSKVNKLILDLRKKFQKPRPSWDDYFISITDEVAKRATCLRGKIGVVIVKNKRIICTGYNGSPKGLPHCTEVGCKVWTTIDDSGKEKENCLRTVHGELNAIAQAALHGVSTEGATLYGTYKPCSVCMKLIVNAGIVRVVCKKNYNDLLTDEIAKRAKVELIVHQPDKSSFEEFK